MGNLSQGKGRDATRLDQISTHWSQLEDPGKVVMRYERAIREYLRALLRDGDRADEVAQSFLLAVLQRGFPNADAARGRFRDYLKTSVRNAAVTFLRHARPPHGEAGLHGLADPASADARWQALWRQCVIERAWRGLEQHQYNTPGNLSYTVLRVLAENPDEGSEALTARVSQLTGHALRPDAFRKQLSRARRRFAELLVDEVRKTLAQPGPDELEAELAELGLTPYVKGFLPTS